MIPVFIRSACFFMSEIKSQKAPVKDREIIKEKLFTKLRVDKDGNEAYGVVKGASIHHL